MRGRDFEAWIESTGYPRKAICIDLGVTPATISRLVRYRGPIPHRYEVAIRYWEKYGCDEPILTVEEIRTAWTAPVWKLAEFIGMTTEHMYRVLEGHHPIKKVTSMAIRQAIKDYYGQTTDDTPATARD